MNSPTHLAISVVLPLFNEEAAISPLYVRLTQVLTGLDQPYEIIFVDDGSKDLTPEVLNDIHESDSRVKVVTLRRNFGQTAGRSIGDRQPTEDMRNYRESEMGRQNRTLTP